MTSSPKSSPSQQIGGDTFCSSKMVAMGNSLILAPYALCRFGFPIESGRLPTIPMLVHTPHRGLLMMFNIPIVPGSGLRLRKTAPSPQMDLPLWRKVVGQQDWCGLRLGILKFIGFLVKSLWVKISSSASEFLRSFVGQLGGEVNPDVDVNVDVVDDDEDEDDDHEYRLYKLGCYATQQYWPPHGFHFW